MRHFLTTADWSQQELQQILDSAAELKRNPLQPHLAGRSVALLFLNPSMRTRTSFELGTWQMGGHAVVLQPGKDAWGIEFDPGVVMDGEAEEHIQEVAGVLSRYVDMIGIRAFPRFQDWSVDRQDRYITALAKHATVPVINMETITHPCQEMALMHTIQEHLGQPDNRKFVLTWTYHPKPLNTAVANSALLIASKFGMDVTLLCPNEEYLLDSRYLRIAEQNVAQYGGSFNVSHDIESAYSGAQVVYAKSWGALPYFGRWEQEQPMREQSRHFMVDEHKMALTDNALFSHCLPVRRNVKVSDAVLDSPRCVAIDEAENRLHVQKALMSHLISTADA